MEGLKEVFEKVFNVDFTVKSRQKSYVSARKAFCWYCTTVLKRNLREVGEMAGVNHDTVLYHRDDFDSYVMYNRYVADLLRDATGYDYFLENRRRTIIESLIPHIDKLPIGREKDLEKLVGLNIKSYIALNKNDNENKTEIIYVADSVTDWMD